MILNPYVPPAPVRAVLGPAIAEACATVDDLAARLKAADRRAAEYGPKAENPDKFYNAAVRAAVAAGGQAADVPDERAMWAREYELAQHDRRELRTLVQTAWRDLRDTLRAHGPGAISAIEEVIGDAALAYRAALDDAELAEEQHRQAMTVRKWIATAERDAGPDGFKPNRQESITAEGVTATPAQALAVLRSDADTLHALHELERRARARAEREERIARDRREAAEKRARDEAEAAKRHAEQRARRLEAEREKTAAAEAAAIPGVTPA